MLIKKLQGFTLLEILIAIFIFAIISTIMVSALHSTLTTQTGVEKSSARFTQLQHTMIILSRDFEQIIKRPIKNASNTIEPALKGTYNEITFTHGGISNPTGELMRSTLQRVRYFSRHQQIWRETWPRLDITRDTKSSERLLLNNIEEFHFEYLDSKGKFHNSWPTQGQAQGSLPKAIRVFFTMKDLGKIQQLYVLPY